MSYIKKYTKYKELISLKISLDNTEDYNNTYGKKLEPIFKTQKQIQK